MKPDVGIALDGRYRELHDRQYAVEVDRFINPGEDPLPEDESDVPEVVTRVPRATAL